MELSGIQSTRPTRRPFSSPLKYRLLTLSGSFNPRRLAASCVVRSFLLGLSVTISFSFFSFVAFLVDCSFVPLRAACFRPVTIFVVLRGSVVRATNLITFNLIQQQ